MFRLRGNSKNTKRSLLGLALKDGDWVVQDGTTLSVNTDKKVIQLPLEGNIDSNYARKLQNLIAVIDAKHSRDRKLVGVKHLKEYLDMVMRITTYWHLVKKATKYTDKLSVGSYDILEYYNRTAQQKLEENVLRDWFADGVMNNTLDLKAMARYVFSTIGGIEWLRTKLIHQDSDLFYSNRHMYDNPEADTSYVTNMYREFCEILFTAYDMVMSTRKDSKQVPNKKVKEVAQYLYDNIESMQTRDIQLPSQILAELDITIPSNDVIHEDDVQRLQDTVMDHLNRSSDGNAVWGTMEIVKHKLTKKLPPKINGVAKKKSDIGVNPKAMNRYATDKKIFTSKTKRPGGTVLIDVSGSMDFYIDDIEELVHTLPAATIAMYSGSDREDIRYEKYDEMIADNTPVGKLQIIASGGKWVENIPSRGQQNLIDGPALDWLGKQPEPRILVSDCRFSGVKKTKSGTMDVDFCPVLTTEAMKKIADKNIIPIMTVEKAKKWAENLVNN